MVDQITEPTRSEKDFEVRDEKFIYQTEWVNNDDELRELVKEIINYVKAYNTHVLYSFGLFYRKIDAFKLLASLFLKLNDMKNFELCIKMLSALYPENRRYYKYLQLFAVTNQREKLLDTMKKMKGCERFLLSSADKNPLVSWCDESCSAECEKKYLGDLKKLVNSFYISK